STPHSEPNSNTRVGGWPGGITRWLTWRTAISYASTPPGPGRAARAGGTYSGVAYLVIVFGSSVPPGTGSAYAGVRTRYAVGTSSAAPPTVVAFRSWRRVGMGSLRGSCSTIPESFKPETFSMRY